MRSPSILLENHLFSASIGQQTEPSESLIIARESKTDLTSPSQPTNTPLPTIGLTVLATLILALVTLWLQKENLLQFLQSILPKDLSQEIAVDIEVLNIRTKDYLRANIQATIYLYIADDDQDKKNARKFLVEETTISAAAVEKAVKKRAEAAIRAWASQYKLDELHQNRTNFEVNDKKVEEQTSTDSGANVKEQNAIYPAIKKIFNNWLNCLQSTFTKLVIHEVDTNTGENIAEQPPTNTGENIAEQPPTNTGAKAIKTLNNGLNPLGLTIRQLVIGEIEEIVNYNQDNYFDAKAIQNRTEAIQDAIYKTRKKELLTEQKIREEELEIGKNIRIHELKIGIELEKLEVNHQKTSLENLKVLTEVEKGKIDHELTIEEHQIDKTISIIDKEKKRLEKERERAIAEEDVTTAIEEAQSNRHKSQAKIAAESVESEAKTIERLAEAEGKRYHLIPATDADRTAQMIRELAPEIMKNLPQIVEMAKALAPQAGVLGNSNIYFPNGNGEDIHKLILSTSSLLLIQSLLDGKLGTLLLELLRSLKNDSNSE